MSIDEVTSAAAPAVGTAPLGRVHVLVPAHNEEAGIEATLAALRAQTYQPATVTVIADNCTDRTVELARAAGVSVVETVDNVHKKAGALNQVLHELLDTLGDDDLVFVQDADSALDNAFLENAARYLTAFPQLGAVGGTFRAQPAVQREGSPDEGAGAHLARSTWNANSLLLQHLQDSEYARYARDVRRLDGKCLVVTGTAAMFRARMLQDLSRARLDGRLPEGDGRGGIYDPRVLTEDNELSFAIMHLGYELLAPPSCTLTTEAMPTWRELWNQRLRWKRGAVENCVQYGLTKITAAYWGRQLLTMLGVVITVLYLSDRTLTIALGAFHVQWLWMGITLIFMLERFITVRDKGLRHQLAAFTMYELPFDLYLQATHAKAYADALIRTERKW
ncbi:glycosyltransferase [Arsenicicoccus piscis]|uniref:glycosyltransferase family 2 protein n=1 Tax=Arsenicicoccus piscis TaxID=673954 RepID=UPI001F4C93AC|nr:glycosyltransferase family 2 protein [Arsenicicoccus piscis]MCH8626726.1 glycosyltransferase [Arsenicicoccus piscis]